MQTKTCPKCSAEYFAHVDICADCHVELITQMELRGHETEKKGGVVGPNDEPVAIRQGEESWMKELRKALLDIGISSYLNLSPDCSAGNCNSISSLFVARRDAERADRHLHEYLLKSHPEFAEGGEVDSDTCPACGHHTGKDTQECPDCGLVLSI